MPARIAICLVTFNGTRFPKERLDSTAARCFGDWHPYFHDDGLSDSSPAILSNFASRYPGRVTIWRDPMGHLDAIKNFGRLMAEPQGRPRRSKLDTVSGWLRARVDAEPDIRMPELADRLEASMGCVRHPPCCPAT